MSGQIKSSDVAARVADVKLAIALEQQAERTEEAAAKRHEEASLALREAEDNLCAARVALDSAIRGEMEGDGE